MAGIIHNVFNREWLRVGVLLWALNILFFWNVVFADATFLTSTFTFIPGTMPNGPYGYTGHRVTSQPTRDSGASAWQTEPWNRLAARMVKTGQLPLWNPYAGTGAPLAANMQSAVFYPINALTYLAPDDAWVTLTDLLTLLSFFVAGFFTYLFVRSIKVNPVAAVGSAVAYMFCGYLLFFVGTADWRVDTMLPMLIYASERLFSKKDICSTLLAAVSVYLVITAGMPESTLLALLLAALYYAFRALTDWSSTGHSLAQLIKCLIPFALAILLGVALSALLIVPFLEYVGVSWNSHSAGAGVGYIPVEGAISLLVPYFFGAVLQGWYYPYLWGTLPYIGAVVAFLSLLSFKRRTETTAFAYFFAGVCAVYLLKAFGSPIAQWIGNLPLLDISVFPRFAAAPFMFSTAVLAGIGIHNVLLGRVRLRRALGCAGLVLAVIGGFTLYFWPHIDSANQIGYVLLQVAIESTFLFLSCFVFLFLKQKVLGPRAAATLVLWFLVADLFVASPKDRSDKYDPYTTPPFAEYLLKDKEPVRVLGLDRVLYPNTAGVYGLEGISDLDALYPNRYTTFIGRFITSGFGDRFTGEDIVYQSKFLDLLNVKYFLSEYPLLDRWKSTDIVSLISEGCRTLSSCPGFRLDKESNAAILQLGTASQPVGRASHLSSSLQLPQDKSLLRFDVGLESVPTADRAQVTFELHLQDKDGEHLLFSRQLNSTGGPTWTWSSQVVDLTQFAGQNVKLDLVTVCNSSCSSFTEAAWRKIELIQPSEDYVRVLMSSFVPVEQDLHYAQRQAVWEYAEEVRIYKNDSAYPRVFVVHSMLPAEGSDDALDKLASPGFDPSKQVILEGAAADKSIDLLSKVDANDFAAAAITKRAPNDVAIKVSMEQPGFLVLTDTFYPGWKATVDGQDAKIYPADYLFRAVHLGSGEHVVEFIYDPLSFRIGLSISLIALCVGISCFAYSRFRQSTKGVA